MAIAYALFKLQFRTFEIQAETFKEQQKISKLENSKFLLSLRPEFKIIRKVHQASNFYNYDHVDIHLQLNDKIASYYYVQNISPFSKEVVPESSSLFLPKESVVKLLMGLMEKDNANKYLEIQIHFSDEVGTPYLQTITGFYHDPIISTPIMNSKNGKLES